MTESARRHIGKPVSYVRKRALRINPYNTAEVEDLAWRYSFHAGRQDPLSKSDHLYAWAVHSGDVGMMMAAVPEPETYALMLAGLSTVALVARRRRRDEI